ncbi:MAG: response regulator transcription factor [Myxococcota bacterium]|nr:response regulator transcription factor [Myxococcota bacterium]
MIDKERRRRVLVIEDEPDLAQTLCYNLKKAGYEAVSESRGGGGLARVATFDPDLIILDLMLPDASGFEVCRALKSNPETARAPVVMLTARGEEVDRVLGFEVGAEDYVLKPFSVRELLLRIAVILKRQDVHEESGEKPITFGPLQLNKRSHQVWVDDVEISLTILEFKLLSTFLERRGETQSRERLLSDVWGYEGSVSTRTVDTHIKRLREKIGPSGRYIQTIRGVGYRFQREPD